MDDLHSRLPADALSPDGGVCPEACDIHSLSRAADYTTLFRRIQRLDLSLTVTPEILAEDVILAVDGTGIQVTNQGEWMRWKVEELFSSLKRIFGEGVRATSREGMFREVRMKVNCYNILIAMVA